MPFFYVVALFAKELGSRPINLGKQMRDSVPVAPSLVTTLASLASLLNNRKAIGLQQSLDLPLRSPPLLCQGLDCLDFVSFH